MSTTGASNLNRRTLLSGGGRLGALALMAGSGAGRFVSTASAADVMLEFEGWNYDPAFQTDIVNEFMKLNPGIQAKFTAQPADVYLPKMIARFSSGNAPDLLYVRDQTVAGWADAEYIRPINEFPGWQKLTEGLIPFHTTGMVYNGKVWGLPYYGDHIAFIYNDEFSSKVGLTKTPETWNELTQQALEIKKAGLLDKPIVYPLKVGAGLYWWSAVYASGGSLFDEAGDPKFPDKDPVALQFLEWLVDAARNKQVLDPNSVQMGTAETRLAMAAGKVAFAPSARYDLKIINDPQKSKISGHGKQILYPSLTTAGPHATLGWTQIFAISKATKNPEQAWKLLQFISSREVAKRYYLKNGVGYAYQSLDNDPEITAETSRWSDQQMFAKQGALAKARESLPFTWALEWEDYNQQQLQEAVLGRKTPREALTASAAKARDLKKQSL